MNLLSIVFLISLAAPQDVGEQGAAEPVVAQQDTDSASSNGQMDEIYRDVQELKKKNEQLAKDIEALKDDNKGMGEKLEAIEEESFEAEMAEDTDTKKVFDVYGFFDLTFINFFAEDSNLHNLVPANPTFTMTQLNLYFYSEMTHSLSAIAELKFSFLPLGQEHDLAVLQYGIEYDREDTTVNDQITNEEYRYGSVTIERVHLTYQPFDFFGVIAGRFLTPYGIWNVDHGSPVLLTVNYPYMQIQQIVPTAQTGIQLFGRAFLSSSSFIDYAFTLSNGRGPIESVVDLDDNKGLGLKFKYTYNGDKVTAAVGAYGYMGDYTDIKKTLESTAPLDVVATDTAKYREWAGSVDFQLNFFGVLLQSEYASAIIKYDDDLRPRVSGGYMPNYTTYSYYILLGYSLPKTGTMSVTPYFMFQQRRVDDINPDNMAFTFSGGINFKPSPYVALKTEYLYKYSPDLVGTNWSYVAAQMAVAF
jgi:opacity protein-like surface antigen